jgi:hypothetical protein
MRNPVQNDAIHAPKEKGSILDKIFRQSMIFGCGLRLTARPLLLLTLRGLDSILEGKKILRKMQKHAGILSIK